MATSKRPLPSAPCVTGDGDTTAFQEAFGPLAHHLFPDGCPQINGDHSNDMTRSDEPDISDEWPTRENRTAVSSQAAIASIAAVLQFSYTKGLTNRQLWCVCLAACETLPIIHRNRDRVDLTIRSADAAGSALVDGTSKHFCSIVRCMIPSRHGETSISSSIIIRLLSIRCGGEGNATVLRFLTLALRSGYLEGHARETLSNMYGAVFIMTSNPFCCLDAVRLLHAETRRRHVRVDRARRLRGLYDQSITAATNKKERAAHGDNHSDNMSNPRRLSSVWLLLQLYARYDPSGCGLYFPAYRRMSSSAWWRSFQIPDESWEQAFRRSDPTVNDRPEKRLRLTDNTGQAISHALPWLDKAFDGVHSFSWGLIVGKRRRCALQASDLLSDSHVQQLLLLATGPHSRTGENSSIVNTELIRLHACLPFMLHEEWYDIKRRGDDVGDERTEKQVSKAGESGRSRDSTLENCTGAQVDDPDVSATLSTTATSDSLPNPAVTRLVSSARLRLLQVAVALATQSDCLLPEVEIFLLEEILPNWDGFDRNGLLVCHALLPKLAPMSFPEFHAAVLRYLSPHLLYGPATTQYAIVAGTLSHVLERWRRLDWAESVRSSKTLRSRNSTPEIVKQTTLKELVQWTDRMLLKVFLIDDAHELLRQGALLFFETVARCCDEERTPTAFLGAPSPAIVYRCLLSPSALSVDRVCRLLVNYGGIFRRLREQDETASSPRIEVFNCFLWDLCSVLWRCSPLPTLDDPSNLARSKSILFTDVSSELLETLHTHHSGDTVDSVPPVGITKALSISHGAVFCGYATAFCKLRKLPSLDAIHGKTKLEYLVYLREVHGLEGIAHFLTTFVRSLATREARKQSASTTDYGDDHKSTPIQ